MLREFAGKDETDGRLDLPRGDGRLLVVAGETGELLGETAAAATVFFSLTSPASSPPWAPSKLKEI